MTETMNAMRQLITRIAEADAAYYGHDDPIMTDREYDALVDELAEMEKKSHGIILSGSPTQRVSGAVLPGLTQVSHTRPMLSAAKTKSPDEIVRFIGGRRAVVSWKLDGLTLVLRYEGGALKQALTRGEGGIIGEDVTHNVRAMLNVPLTIPYGGPIEVRGEGVISWENFNKANERAEEGGYAHPRNMVAGGIRRLDANKTRAQMLEFFAFELIDGTSLGKALRSKAVQLSLLADDGFSVVPHITIGEQATGDSVKAALNGFEPKYFEYPVDGLIVEYDDLAYGQSLGATGHHENRLMALKWADEMFETTFLGLEAATTRTGMVSLTAKLADVVIDGTTVNRAYLHNLNIVDGLKLGIGDTVQVYKANQIIPQIGGNLTQSGTLEYPTVCPRCGSALVTRESDSGTRMLFCENASCPAKLVRKIVHFCSKSRMNIPDLSEKRLEIFINNGWVRSFGDLYELAKHRQAFIDTPGFGEKLFDRLIKTIEARRSCTLAQFIAGLGIHTVGRTAGRILDEHFKGDCEAFEQALRDGYDFTRLPDFGQTMHDNLHAWYADAEAAKLWRPLLKHITFIKREETISMENTNAGTTANPFTGKIVVATGKLENYTRDGIQMKLLELGAKPASAVTKKTDYLIVGEKAGGKLDKARQLGVAVLTEDEFEAMIGGEAA